MAAQYIVEINSANSRQTPWRLGLVLAALVWLGLPAANQAEEAQHQVMTALSSTTLSGYIDTTGIYKFLNYQEPVPPLVSKSDVDNFFPGSGISSVPVFVSGSGQPDFFGASGAPLEQVPEPSSVALGTLAAALWAGWQVRPRRKQG